MNKNNGMNMKYTITASLLSFVALLNTSYGVQMTPQINSLLEQKNAKIAELEKCDSNRKAWMIAGISTIGLTAVGIGVNIAQASKSKKLDTAIESANTDLKNQQAELDSINAKLGNGNLDPSINGNGFCGNTAHMSDYAYPKGICSVSGSKLGDWKSVFPYGIVEGISACSSLRPANTDDVAQVASNQGKVEADYNAESDGEFCYCKMTKPASSWVFFFNAEGSCAGVCAEFCGSMLIKYADYRRVIFGSVGK